MKAEAYEMTGTLLENFMTKSNWLSMTHLKEVKQELENKKNSKSTTSTPKVNKL